jgi:hypothetical protein
MIANSIFAGALCARAVAAAGAGSRETLAVEERAYDSEHFAAYCIGVFGADQTSLKSRFVPTCLTNEAADECSARIADIDQKRHHVDLALRGLQDSLARRGIIAPNVTRGLPSTLSLRRAGKAYSNYPVPARQHLAANRQHPARLSRNVIGRVWPRFAAPNFHRDDCTADLIGSSDMAR